MDCMKDLCSCNLPTEECLCPVRLWWSCYWWWHRRQSWKWWFVQFPPRCLLLIVMPVLWKESGQLGELPYGSAVYSSSSPLPYAKIFSTLPVDTGNHCRCVQVSTVPLERNTKFALTLAHTHVQRSASSNNLASGEFRKHVMVSVL